MRWCILAIVLALPSALYAAVLSTPEVPFWEPGSVPESIVHITAPALLIVCNGCVMPLLASRVSSRSKIRVVELLAVGRLLSTWLVALGVIFLLHQNCVGAWVKTWSGCNDNLKSFEVQQPIHVNVPVISYSVLLCPAVGC